MNSDDEDDKAEDSVKSGKDVGSGKTDKVTYKDTDLDKLTKECTSLLEKELDSWKKSGTEGNEDASKFQKLSSETKDENAKKKDVEENPSMNRKKSPKKPDTSLEKFLESNYTKAETKSESSSKESDLKGKNVTSDSKEDTNQEGKDNKNFTWPPKKD